MADGFVATSELRFVARIVCEPRPELGAGIEQQRVQRILQQRWVLFGVMHHEMLNDGNSEWRDVPLVSEPQPKSPIWCPGCSQHVEGACSWVNCAIGPNGLQAKIDAQKAGA